MGNLRILTAGESHGKGLIGILEGMPAGLKIDREKIDSELKRRQQGYGRGSRMKIESDRVQVFSGIRFGVTLGSPIGIFIENKDWVNWGNKMGVWEGEDDSPVHIPRPGHADLAGAIKYGHKDIRNVLERASARETAVRVALGAIIKQLLESFNIWIASHVIQIHKVRTDKTFRNLSHDNSHGVEKRIHEMAARADDSDIRCCDQESEAKMREAISVAGEQGDTVGGMFEIAALGVPIGLGTYASWDKRLGALIAASIMSIPGIKAVEIGMGTECASSLGSLLHDQIIPGQGIPSRPTNHAGGIEGGVSNGEAIIVQATMKPIPTLKKPLHSVDLVTGEAVSAHQERSDVCAVPAASVVGEAMMAISIGTALCERYGGDSIEQMKRHFDADQPCC